MTIYALVDCNNFYVSCERVFNPKLDGRPVIILSSNDGCAIARSNEAKEFGVKLAQPLYQFTGIVKKHDIQVLSGNFHLYTDMSNRVMQVLADMAPAAQQYSIDECFLDITWLPDDLDDYGLAVQAKVRQWTGIPVGVSIAQTKTLAKVTNVIDVVENMSLRFDRAFYYLLSGVFAAEVGYGSETDKTLAMAEKLKGIFALVAGLNMFSEKVGLSAERLLSFSTVMDADFHEYMTFRLEEMHDETLTLAKEHCAGMAAFCDQQAGHSPFKEAA
jgi:hypothetical protein